MSMTVLRKHVNILNGFNKVKQQTEDTSEGNMKHLKLGKIQWIALLVVSAMFVNFMFLFPLVYCVVFIS